MLLGAPANLVLRESVQVQQIELHSGPTTRDRRDDKTRDIEAFWGPRIQNQSKGGH